MARTLLIPVTFVYQNLCLPERLLSISSPVARSNDSYQFSFRTDENGHYICWLEL